MGPRVKRLIRGLVYAGGLALLSLVVLVAAARVVPLPPVFDDPGSTVIEFRDGSVAHVFLSPDEKWRIDVDLKRVDSRYVDALLALEDQRFFSHVGVDPVAIVRATITNLKRGRVVSGASTLTMQLVRMREPRPRTLSSKLQEAFRALQVEARYSKKEILQRYLSHVPYGRNIEGIEAAALTYFGHGTEALSLDEVAVLLAVPQNPSSRYPTVRNKRRLRAARDDIADRLRGWGLGREGEDAAAFARTKVPTSLRAFPRSAPHAAYWLRARERSPRIKTTLDRAAQGVVERIAKNAARSQQNHGIDHGAVVVVDHKSAEVRAMVGSFDYWQDRSGATIAGFDVPRSPGSALKPFIFALGIDGGYALPEHRVLDTPRQFGVYRPKNYDGQFSGLVEFETALSRSLNVPFVNLLAQLGVDDFTGHLQSWGVRSLVPEAGHYGLSAAIGGLELTPLEMAGLYGMIARGGGYRELHWIKGTDAAESAGLSAGASWLTQRALRKRDRPDFPDRRRFSQVSSQLAWKTGTSYGHRDAWAAGSLGDMTAVVWMGNFDQRASVHLVGSEAAGPVLFDVLEALARPRNVTPAPADLTEIQVCRFSGRLPGPGCHHTETAYALTAQVPTETCPYHVQMDVDAKSGLALSAECRSDFEYETKSFMQLPASLARHLSERQRSVPTPPALHPNCGGAGGPAPVIVSPSPGLQTVLLPGVDAKRQEIPLSAESSAETLAWFVDGQFVGQSAPSERLWWTPTPGRHEVVVTDPNGQSARQQLLVDRHM